MKFNTSAESYNFYKSMPKSIIEARSSAIEQEIRSNADADLSAISVELDGINAVLDERKSEPKAETRASVMMTADDARGDAGSAEYRSAFSKHLMGRRLSDAERNAFEQVNRRSAEFNESANSGAILPTTMLNEIISEARDQGGIMGISRAFSMPSNIAIPIATPTSAAQWHAEGSEVESERIETTSVTFSANEIVKLLSISERVRRMSIAAFESYLMNELRDSVLSCIAQAMVDGDGNGKPSGILAEDRLWDEGTDCVVTSEDDFTWRDLVELLALLHRGYASNASFVCSPSFFYRHMVTLHDDSNLPLFVDDVKSGAQGRLLGRPVILDDFMPDTTLLLGDFRYLAWNMPEGIRISVSEQSSFSRALIDYRAVCLADARVILPEAFVKLEFVPGA